jgi:hypothetical protein
MVRARHGRGDEESANEDYDAVKEADPAASSQLG